MEQIIKRILRRLFPELAGGYHLPRFAVVSGIADAPQDGALCDNFRPRYAVDLQLLTKTGEVDNKLPPLLGVPVSMATGGDEIGFLALPSEGTKVVVQFINGLPNWPIVTAVLPNDLMLAPMQKGQAVWIGGLGGAQSVSVTGDWTRSTPADITDTCDKKTSNAQSNNEYYCTSQKVIIQHDKQTIGGDKETTIAGKYEILAANDMKSQTASNLTISAGKELTINTGKELTINTGKDFAEMVGNKKTIKAKQLYLGNDLDNSLQLLSELMQATASIASALQLQPIAAQITQLNTRLTAMLPLTP